MAPHSRYPSSHSSPCSWVSLARLEAALTASKRTTVPGSMLVLVLVLVLVLGRCCD